MALGSNQAGRARLLLEQLPELQVLVGGRGRQRLAVGAQRAVQDAAVVGRDLGVLDERRVAPDADAVVGEAARRRELLVRRAPPQRRHLAARVDAVGARARRAVPEVNVPVVAAAARREQVQLPRAPRQRLDGGFVVGLGELGRAEAARVPDVDEVVVAAGGELRAVGAPLEAADLAGVGDELGDLVLRDADVVVVDEAAAGAGGEEVLVPAFAFVLVHVTEESEDGDGIPITPTRVSWPCMLRSFVPSSTSQICTSPVPSPTLTYAPSPLHLRDEMYVSALLSRSGETDPVSADQM